MQGSQCPQFPIKNTARVSVGVLIGAALYFILTLIINSAKNRGPDPLTPGVPRGVAIALPIGAGALGGLITAAFLVLQKWVTQGRKNNSITNAQGDTYRALDNFAPPLEPLDIPRPLAGMPATISSQPDDSNEFSFAVFRANVQEYHSGDPEAQDDKPVAAAKPLSSLHVVAGARYIPSNTGGSAFTARALGAPNSDTNTEKLIP